MNLSKTMGVSLEAVPPTQSTTEMTVALASNLTLALWQTQPVGPS